MVIKITMFVVYTQFAYDALRLFARVEMLSLWSNSCVHSITHIYKLQSIFRLQRVNTKHLLFTKQNTLRHYHALCDRSFSYSCWLLNLFFFSLHFLFLFLAVKPKFTGDDDDYDEYLLLQ